MPVVGSAEVLIRPTFSNFQKDIAREMRGAGLRSGTVGGSTLRNTLATWGKRAAVAAGAAVVTGLGAALTMGFQRLTAIENAEAKLRGLGHSAREVEGIMKNALDAVKGTAFGLDEAAGLAGVMVASGIEPGKQLERVLRLVADSATIAGTDLSDMGLIWGKVAAKGKLDGQIVNQMLERQIPILDMLAEHYGVTAAEVSDMVSQGKVDFEDFATVMEDKLGGAALSAGDTTVGAFKNMRAAFSRFGVSLLEGVFPLFQQAFAGITEWLDNATESVKPFGEAFGRWVTDSALPAIQEFGAWLRDELWPVLKDVGAEIGGAFSEAWASITEALDEAGFSADGLKDNLGGGLLSAIQLVGGGVAWAVTKLGELVTFMIDNKDAVLGFASAVAGVAGALKGLKIAGAVAGGITALKTALGLGGAGAGAAGAAGGAAGGAGLLGKAARFAKFGVIGAAIGALAYFLTQTETGKKIVSDAWDWIKQKTKPIVEWWEETVAPALSDAWKTAKSAIDDFLTWWENDFAPAVSEVWTKIKKKVDEFLDWWDEHVGPVIKAGAELIEEVWGQIEDAAEDLKSTLEPIWQWMEDQWSETWEHFKRVWAVIGEPVLLAIEGAWEGFKIFLETTWENIKTAVETALAFIASMIRAVTSAIRGDWDEAWEHVKTAFSDAWDGIKEILDNTLGGIQRALKVAGDKLKAIWASVWEKIKEKIDNIWQWIVDNVFTPMKKKLDDAVAWFRDLRDKVSNAFNTMRDRLRTAWNNIKSWVFDKIKEGIESVREYFSGRVDRIKEIWDTLKEKFRAVKDWIKTNVFDKFKGHLDNVLEKVRTIRDALGRAWNAVANKFRTPINWVINTVWNDGIRSVFNRAASAIGIDTRLPLAPSIPAFAKGGYHKGGWALVGEEGPELVNFASPGQVYTAKQTQEIMNSGPVGDLKDDLAAALGAAAGAVTNFTMGGAVDGLKAAAGAVLNPLKGLIRETVGQWGSMGRLAGSVGTTAINELLKWVGKKEEDQLAKTMGGGFVDGGSAPGSGAWRRPSRGPITSGYGPRWGAFHAGIDIAGGGPTYAAADGTVFRVGTGILTGRTGVGIGISHGGGVFTYYGHNPYGGPRVKPGQKVQAGQHIGYQGATGNVTGTHVHFELHRGGWGRNVNPRQLGVFDQGGMLAPGAMAINLGSKPEPVLTPGQWDAMARGGSGQEFNFNGPITTVDVDAAARAIARKQRDAMAVYSPALGGV